MVCDGMPGMMMECQRLRKKNLNEFLMPLGLALPPQETKVCRPLGLSPVSVTYMFSPPCLHLQRRVIPFLSFLFLKS